MDANPAWITNQPFRFMDLPPEIRTSIYGHLFENAVLVSGDATDESGFFPNIPFLPRGSRLYIDKDNVYGSGHMPGLLTASKTIRDEAFAVFTGSLIPLFQRETKKHISSIPAEYLDNVECAVVDADFDGQVNEILLPKLRDLWIRDWGYWFIGHGDPAEATDQMIRDEMVDLVRGRSAMAGVDLRVSQGRLKFEIVLSTTMWTESAARNYHMVLDWLRDEVLLRDYITN